MKTSPYKMPLFTVIYNALVLLGIACLYYVVLQHPGNHWALFGTTLEELLKQWKLEITLLVTFPNIVLALYSVLSRKYMAMALFIVITIVQITLLTIVLDLALD